MSMELGNDNEFRGGGGGFSTGMAMGSMMNRDDDKGRTMMMAAIIIVIVFFVAIIFLALAFKDRGHDRVGSGTDVAALIATMTAAKGMDNGSNAIDKFEIMQKIEHSEDRARETQTQQEIAAQGKSFMEMGFGLSSKIDNAEKKYLETYAILQNQLGMQGKAIEQLLTVQNNTAIIDGVIMKLRAC